MPTERHSGNLVTVVLSGLQLVLIHFPKLPQTLSLSIRKALGSSADCGKQESTGTL